MLKSPTALWITVLLLILASVPAASAAKLRRIDVPTDPKAQYFLQQLSKRADGRITVTTVRRGPVGTSYSTRIVDCAGARFAYAADGDSLEEFRSSRHEPTEYGPLTTGSISFYVAKAACGMAK
jgi:hypothetical protein